jgi:Zn-dependent peptidase ImmA (M78 family)
VVNDHDSPAAWSFTVLHEVVHLCLGQTGISGARADSAIERFCNEVASAFLLDREELDELDVDSSMDVATAAGHILAFARSRNLSRAMVAYRLYRTGGITYDYWRSLHDAFYQSWLQAKGVIRAKAKAQESGPNYYVVRRHRVGSALINFVRRMLGSNTLTTIKAAKVLAVKPQNVGALLATVGPSDAGRAT